MNRQQRPNLKNGVDLQLQSAFNDGNWAVVIRLAEKRARTFNDQYYEIVKICAESQLDDPSSKFAAITAIDKYVREGTVVKDVDGLDLLEWAAQGLNEEDEYPETLGPLRARLVKAAPKDKIGASRCLESCLLHWDLVSAQQIAATLDRSFPQERTLMFWNIVITHLLATSPQSPPEKKKLYGMLALKQIQRAAQLAEQAATAEGNDAKPQPRSIQTEEEILLLYDVTEKHGSKEDFVKLTSSPVFSPFVQFQKGRKELLLRTITRHQQEQDFEAIFQLCKDCLSVDDENGQPSLLAADWKVWRHFIDAAAQIKTVKPDVEETVQGLLLKFIKSPNLRPIYKRIILLARVSAAFNLASNDRDDLVENEPASFRLKELIKYIDDQGTNTACFDDIKPFVEKLNPSAMKHLAYDHAPKLAEDMEDEVKSARVRNLSFKLQYFAATCPSMYSTIPGDKPLRKCIVSQTDVDARSPGPAFASISEAALKAHQSLADLTSKSPSMDAEIRPELAVIVALCHVQAAFPPSTDVSHKPISYAPLLQALLLLEYQLTLAPKHSIISLLLVQLHLLVGSTPRAHEIWDTLGVKRTIMDSLAPIFYDRLSTISPALISPSDETGWELLELLSSHYNNSLKLRMPRRLIDAFESNSYSSVIDIPSYMEDLRWSCTRVMSLVEETRTDRIMGENFSEVFTDPRFAQVTDDTKLVDNIDYGSFPSWDSSSRPPIYSRLRVGPAPTNRRAHLSLLSEAFHELLSYKPPAIYKASAAAAVPDQIFVLESLRQLSNSFTKFSNGPMADLTSQEATYFEVIGLLSTLIPFTTGINRANPIPEEFAQIVDTLKIALDTLKLDIISLEGPSEQVKTLSTFHSLAILRDTAAAVKNAAQWIIAFNDREKERDRSGKSNLPKDVMAQIKDVAAASEVALKEGKEAVTKLREQVYGRDFEPAVRKWIFEGAEDTLEIIGEGTTKSLVKSWETNIKGWTQVKWN
ncbi:N-acetyltransferase B complex non catalytic subunit-domain-containing protein [Fusarium tricinctum]|uniref:N-acetyltransferase B complex non catalytic subunit-domain-containing protein n=1 Tax=Fusarium tricinctum TaxID=61284 RepID=A0A8K0RPJ3_9HYPO|nr:N-acetyltransferase B complex non catalytic subunit-domain-containing protein [Fusarium tricinctum]